MGLRRTRLDGDRALKCSACLFVKRAIQLGDPKQMQTMEIVRQVLKNALAECLDVRLPALSIGRNGDRKPLVRLLSFYLLSPRILKSGRTDRPLQALDLLPGVLLTRTAIIAPELAITLLDLSRVDLNVTSR